MNPSYCPACRSASISRRRAQLFGPCDLWRCAACRSEFLAPQPDDARLAEIYGADYYDPWSEEAAPALHRMKQLTFDPILRAAATPPARILDVGCATGSFLALAVARGYEGYGVDLNSDAIAQARSLVPGAKFHAGTLADEPFPGEQFDAVVMIDFIEHVRDPEAELRRITKRLAPEGHLVISTPRTDSSLHAALRGAWPQYREEHLTYFSRRGIEAVLQRCGLTVLSVRPTWKRLTLAYTRGQAIAYPVAGISQVVRATYAALPPLRHVAFPITLGEMTVVATPSA